VWYVAIREDEWLALLSISAAALKCGARDRWIGWDFRHQYDRLNLIANNSRFLILPRHHHPNLASKVLSLCQRSKNSGDIIHNYAIPIPPIPGAQYIIVLVLAYGEIGKSRVTRAFSSYYSERPPPTSATRRPRQIGVIPAWNLW
jgi:Druantia protein DruA